ncbi:HSP70-interacting protein [Entamoeba marina]
MNTKAEDLKKQGNDLLAKGDFEKAIEKYSDAIKIEPLNSIYFANRSLAYIKLSKFKDAELDINLSIQCNSKYVKAYLRRAIIHKHFNHNNLALNDYNTVLSLEPLNKEAMKGISDIEKEVIKEDKIDKTIEELDQIKIPSKLPSSKPHTYAEFERVWKDLNDELKQKYLDFIDTKDFDKFASDNITASCINQIALIMKDDLKWAQTISSFKRMNFLKLFVSPNTKEWLEKGKQFNSI